MDFSFYGQYVSAHARPIIICIATLTNCCKIHQQNEAQAQNSETFIDRRLKLEMSRSSVLGLIPVCVLYQV